MKLHLKAFLILSFLFAINLQAQQKMLLLNGKEIEIKSYTVDDNYVNYKRSTDKPGKTRLIEKYDVFSVKKEDGTEDIIYKSDSLSFTVEEARNYIRGEQAADKFYHKPVNKWTAGVVGVGASVLSFYSLPVPMLYSVVVGRINPKNMQIPDGYDAPYSSTEEYRFGYNKKARNLKIQQSLKWGYIGLGVGLAGYIIYGISTR
jgi:hypothetical protein